MNNTSINLPIAITTSGNWICVTASLPRTGRCPRAVWCPTVASCPQRITVAFLRVCIAQTITITVPVYPWTTLELAVIPLPPHIIVPITHATVVHAFSTQGTLKLAAAVSVTRMITDAGTILSMSMYTVIVTGWAHPSRVTVGTFRRLPICTVTITTTKAVRSPWAIWDVATHTRPTLNQNYLDKYAYMNVYSVTLYTRINDQTACRKQFGIRVNIIDGIHLTQVFPNLVHSSDLGQHVV